MLAAKRNIRQHGDVKNLKILEQLALIHTWHEYSIHQLTNVLPVNIFMNALDTN